MPHCARICLLGKQYLIRLFEVVTSRHNSPSHHTPALRTGLLEYWLPARTCGSQFSILSSKVAFNVKVDYSKIDNQYFYVNDTTTELRNKFMVVYDDIMQTHFLGEISYKTSDKFKIGLKGNFFVYDMSKEIEAWHLPTYTISLDARYSLDNKIIATANIYAMSKRKACLYEIGDDGQTMPIAKDLDGAIDVNLGLEYRFTKRFSTFLDLNNITGARYYQWNQYANQRFNFMLGLTYAF